MKQRTRTVSLRSRLQEGGCGKIFLGVDDEEKFLAIKQQKMSGDGIPCLLEACLLFSYNHPYILPGLGFEITREHLLLFLDFANTDLFEWRKKQQRVEVSKIVPWVFQILDALSFLHSQKVAHCDLKMENILLQGDSEETMKILLADFGISRFFYEKQLGDSYTPTHVPPEILLRDPWNEKVDVWSFGVLLFEILYGKSPFPNQDSPELLLETIRIFINDVQETYSKTKNLFDLNPKSSAEKPFYGTFLTQKTEFTILICQCLQWDPTKRPSIEDILKKPIFSKYRRSNYQIHADTILPDIEDKEIQRKISLVSENEYRNLFAFLLYKRSLPILSSEKFFDDLHQEFQTRNKIERNKEILLEACLKIASKLLSIPHILYKTTRLILNYYEVLIARYLQFRLFANVDLYHFEDDGKMTFRIRKTKGV